MKAINHSHHMDRFAFGGFVQAQVDGRTETFPLTLTATDYDHALIGFDESCKLRFPETSGYHSHRYEVDPNGVVVTQRVKPLVQQQYRIENQSVIIVCENSDVVFEFEIAFLEARINLYDPSTVQTHSIMQLHQAGNPQQKNNSHRTTLESMVSVLDELGFKDVTS